MHTDVEQVHMQAGMDVLPGKQGLRRLTSTNGSGKISSVPPGPAVAPYASQPATTAPPMYSQFPEVPKHPIHRRTESRGQERYPMPVAAQF